MSHICKSLVYICSPFRGYNGHSFEYNIQTTRNICKNIVHNGEIPIATHLLFPQFLDDTYQQDRQLGIECGLSILAKCDRLDAYIFEDYISEGMRVEIQEAERLGIPVRKIEIKR